MNDPWNRAEEALVNLETRTRYDEKNRLELLAVHGVKGLCLGPLIYNFGGPDAWNQVFGAEAIVFLAAPCFFGGLLLLLGLGMNRHILLEGIGMFGLLVWDTLMIYVMVRGDTAPYVTVIYTSMAALMLIHLKTLWRYFIARWRTHHVHD